MADKMMNWSGSDAVGKQVNEIMLDIARSLAFLIASMKIMMMMMMMMQLLRLTLRSELAQLGSILSRYRDSHPSG